MIINGKSFFENVEEIENKRLILNTQTGFRKRSSTKDNVYVLNYVMGRDVSKEEGRIFAMIKNLKAAYGMLEYMVCLK